LVKAVEDTAPPARPTITAAPPAGPVKGTGEPHAALTVRTAGGELVCSAHVDAGGNWSCDPGKPLPCGTQLVATQVDGAGNVSEASTPFRVAACTDTTAPAAPTVEGVSAKGAILGAGEPAATVTVTDQKDDIACTAAVQPDGGWSCTPPAPLACGSTLAAFQTDAAGNVSPVSARTSTGIPACSAGSGSGAGAGGGAGAGAGGGSRLPATGSSSTLPLIALTAGLLLAGGSALGLRRGLRVRR
jgi:hypothetical protein